MQRKDVETEIGKINFAYREGEPLIVGLNGFGSFDTAQSFLDNRFFTRKLRHICCRLFE